MPNSDLSPLYNHYSYVVTPPTLHAVTVDQVRIRLRIDDAETDDEITQFIAGAERWWEGATGTALMSQTTETLFSRFPKSEYISLKQSPVQSVSSIHYRNAEGTVVEWDSDKYHADTVANIVFSLDMTWPETSTLPYPDMVRIRMIAGYEDADSVHDDIKQALLLHIGYRYRFRESGSEAIVRPVAYSMENIALRYRRTWLNL